MMERFDLLKVLAHHPGGTQLLLSNSDLINDLVRYGRTRTDSWARYETNSE